MATEVDRPVFVLGLQRSGTTLLHRLLVEGSGDAVSLTMMEMLLPASSVQRGLGALGSVDRRLGGRATRWLHEQQDRRFAAFDPIHRVRLHETEEDEGVLWSIHASDTAVNDSPLTAGDPVLLADCNVTGWSRAEREVAWAWYRAVIMKAVRRSRAEQPRYVGKNPRFSQRIEDLLRVFPDARLVWLVRDPVEAIASRLSMLRGLWGLRHPGVPMRSAQIRWVVEDSVSTYLGALAHLPDVPPEQVRCVRYDDLRSDPLGVARALAASFELAWRVEALPAARRQALANNGSRVSRHRYSLDQFGIDADEIRRRLARLYEDPVFGLGAA